ncbi:MAG: hypothetical protein LC749_11310, partial [Actinobacteria bacterium]|nr:hypothetical protein [Actinomycetota bacterium]
MRTRPLHALRALCVLFAVIAVVLPAQACAAGPTVARSASAAVAGARIFYAPARVTHLAVHWRGGARAGV